MRKIIIAAMSIVFFSQSSAQVVVPYADEIDGSLSRIANRNGIIVHPDIRSFLMAQANIFVSNFCYPADSAEGRAVCRQAIGTPEALDRILLAHLIRLRDERPGKIESFSSLLARSIGRDIAATGFSGNIDNNIAVVNLTTNTPLSALWVGMPAGDTPLGSIGSAMLVPPGEITIVAEFDSGGRARGIATTTARSSATIALNPAINVPPPTSLALAKTDRFCSRVIAPPYPGMAAPFNTSISGRATFNESRSEKEKNLAPVVTQSVISIDLLDPDGLCDTKCRRGLASAFSEAISAWRQGCARCDKNSLTIIRVGDSLQLDAQLLSRMEAFLQGRVVANDLDLNNRFNILGGMSSDASAVVVSTSNIPYSSLEPQLRSKICKLPAGAAPWVDPAQQMFCDGNFDIGVLRPTLTVLAGETSCGGSDYVACGHPDGGIEISFSGGQLQVPFAGLLGKPADGVEVADVRDVLLHEVGHWFGVPHHWLASPDKAAMRSGERPDIMVDVLGEGDACLSPHSLAILENATDLRWPSRVSSKLGLRRRSVQ